MNLEEAHTIIVTQLQLLCSCSAGKWEARHPEVSSSPNVTPGHACLLLAHIGTACAHDVGTRVHFAVPQTGISALSWHALMQPIIRGRARTRAVLVRGGIGTLGGALALTTLTTRGSWQNSTPCRCCCRGPYRMIPQCGRLQPGPGQPGPTTMNPSAMM